MFGKLFLLSAVVALASGAPAKRGSPDNISSPRWQLGMNINPDDGHIFGYQNGWDDANNVGDDTVALRVDYLNHFVWIEPANYIAIVRHQNTIVDAVKVFRFKYWGLSMKERFQERNLGRRIVSDGGPIQEEIADDAENIDDDPIFGVGGELAFNWGYSDNGNRIVLTGGHLSGIDENDDNTHGLGNDYWVNWKSGISQGWGKWSHDASVIQDCGRGCDNYVIQGGDHGSGEHFREGVVYGNYAIYVSESAYHFPGPGSDLDLEMEAY